MVENKLITREEANQLVMEITKLKLKCLDMGFFKTFHAMDGATKAVGWELADMLQGKTLYTDIQGIVNFDYFKKGTYVRTGYGVGIVAEDEKEIKTWKELIYSEVLIQHKFGCSENTSNEVKEIERSMLTIIDEDEYDEEVY